MSLAFLLHKGRRDMSAPQPRVSRLGILPLFVFPLVLACGDDDPAPPDGGTDAGHDAGHDSGADAGPDAGTEVDEEGCRVLTLGARDFQFNLFGQLTGLRYSVGPNLGAETADVLLVEFYDSTTEGLPALSPGTFDLAAVGLQFPTDQAK